MQAIVTPYVCYRFDLTDPTTGENTYRILSHKMIKKIQKGRYFNLAQDKRAYESLDFEPDLPSPSQSFNRFADFSDDGEKKSRNVKD